MVKSSYVACLDAILCMVHKSDNHNTIIAYYYLIIVSIQFAYNIPRSGTCTAITHIPLVAILAV
jgi:hypothetical protein